MELLSLKTSSFRIEVSTSPPKSTDIAVYLGKSVTLDCLALGKPPAQISWILPDRSFVREVGTVHTLLSPMSLLQNGTLRIHTPNFSSKGDYKCIASNAAGTDTITYQLHVAALPPSISEGAMHTAIIQPGESAKLSCQATGEPAPKIMWVSPRNDVISMSSDRFQIMGDGMLVLKKVRITDEGKYTCVARNSAGDDVKNMKLEVESQDCSDGFPTTHHQYAGFNHKSQSGITSDVTLCGNWYSQTRYFMDVAWTHNAGST
uniref:Ig-like domain-containing protein n=1 Tax=Sparus aurata TaxID=8175 RepID=A0A671Y231_SPAAU